MKIHKLLSILFLLIPVISNAQATEEASVGFVEQYKLEIVLGLTVVVCVLALIVLLVALYTIQTLVALKTAQDNPDAVVEERSFWGQLWVSANSFVPIEQEKELLTDHEYDGIKELDNNLPPWWLWGFYVTIVFSVVYLLAFHVFQWAPLQDEEYSREMASAKENVEAFLASQDNLIDETNVELLTADGDLTSGKNMFDANCSVCHGSVGEGGVGPNLTDKYWLHGGDIKDIFKLIKYGNPSKGMISWQNQFTPKKMQQIASYIYTLEGTNPPNPKDPQGELFERGAGGEDSAETETDSTAVEETQISLLK